MVSRERSYVFFVMGVLLIVESRNYGDNHLFFFALTGNIRDLFLDVFDCVAHARRQGATLI